MLAGLDVHTARWVTEKCLKGPLVRGRTVIIVTHDIELLRGSVDSIIHIDTNGYVRQLKDFEADAAVKSEILAIEGEKHQEAVQAESADTPAKPKDAVASPQKLIPDEKVVRGAIGIHALKLYVTNAGGLAFWTLLWFLVFAEAGISLYQPFFLAKWVEKYVSNDPSAVKANRYVAGSDCSDPSLMVIRYFAGFAALIFAEVLLRVLKSLLWLRGSLRASRGIHQQLVRSILNVTFRQAH
jgi:hypothetical protein